MCLAFIYITTTLLPKPFSIHFQKTACFPLNLSHSFAAYLPFPAILTSLVRYKWSPVAKVPGIPLKAAMDGTETTVIEDTTVTGATLIGAPAPPQTLGIGGGKGEAVVGPQGISASIVRLRPILSTPKSCGKM